MTDRLPDRTVPLGTDVGLFRRLHRRMMDSGYPAIPWDALDPSALSDADRETARRAWGARMEAEYRSMVVFGELIARFAEVGLPLELASATTKLVQDEARHTELCARMAEALGGRADVALDTRGLRLVSDDLPAHLFVARWTLSMFCVGESASVALLRELLAAATDPCASAVIRVVLRDEILHDRFGWALARTIVARLTDDEREWLAVDLRPMLAHYDRADAGCMRRDGAALSLGKPDPTAGPLPNLGVTPRDRFARAFYHRLERVILPGIAALGLRAYEAWSLRHESDPAPSPP
jgi:hypothetical protein